MQGSASGFGRSLVVRLASGLCAGLIVVLAHSARAAASPPDGGSPSPGSGQVQGPVGPPSGTTNWDFSHVAEWHLCAVGDLDDCTLECTRGLLPSCVRLGNIYFEGKIVPKDLSRAAELYELPCGFGYGEACFNRAHIYSVLHDAEHAATYYSRACDDGLANGCYHAAIAYDDGKGVPRDVARAAALYQAACDGGDMRGCSDLGVLYVHGDGVAKNQAAAARLFEKACAAGNAGACGNLGSSFRSGAGEPCDPSHAAKLYRQACDGGAKEFCRLIGRSANARAATPAGQ